MAVSFGHSHGSQKPPPREQDSEEGYSGVKVKVAACDNCSFPSVGQGCFWESDKGIGPPTQKITRCTYAYNFAFSFCGTLKCQKTCRLCRNCFCWEPCPCQGSSPRGFSVPVGGLRLEQPRRLWTHSGLWCSPATNHLWLHTWDSFSGQRTSLEIGFGPFLSGDKALSLEEEDLGFSLFCASYSPCDLE